MKISKPMNAPPTIPFNHLPPRGRPKKATIALLAIVGLALFVELPLRAATFTVSADQNWSGFSPQPTSADAIQVGNGAILTVDVANGVCASIQLGLSSGSVGDGSLTFLSDALVTCSGNVTMGQASSQFGTISMVSGGTLQVGGSLTFTAGLSTLSPGSGTTATIEFNGAGNQ